MKESTLYTILGWAVGIIAARFLFNYLSDLFQNDWKAVIISIMLIVAFQFSQIFSTESRNLRREGR